MTQKEGGKKEGRGKERKRKGWNYEAMSTELSVLSVVSMPDRSGPIHLKAGLR
jgi:hypothetical protein